MDTAMEWANAIGTPPSLPASLASVEQRVRLTDLVDSALIAGSFLHKLNDEEKIQRLNVVVELSRSFLPDVGSKDEIENVILRLWAGCMSAAKVIAPSTRSGPNIPAIRTKVFSQKIDILCQTDPIYKAGVETAPSFKKLRGEAFEGIPQNSPVKRYAP